MQPPLDTPGVPEAAADRDTGNVLRLVSWNLRKGKGADGKGVSFDDLAAELGSLRPHLLLCQETFQAAADGATAQSAELASRLRMREAYGPNAVYRRGSHGNATLSLLPILSSSNQDLSTNRVERRGVLYTRHEMPDGPLHVLNTHLGLNTVQRRRQVGRIAAFLLATVPADEPLILAGDFNDWTGSLDAVVRRRCGVECVFGALPAAERRSWPSRRPVFRLDRVYVRHLVAVSVGILREEPFRRLSDHLPVEVCLRPAR